MDEQTIVAHPELTSEVLATLSNGTKVKQRLPRMRACNERNPKGKLCGGHLKRWYPDKGEVQKLYGADAELYRCEHCRTIYLPHPGEQPRTKTLSW